MKKEGLLRKRYYKNNRYLDTYVYSMLKSNLGDYLNGKWN